MMIAKIVSTHHPDWQIIEADCGEQALDISNGKAIDLITLDMNMPGMDGVSLGMELRKRFPHAAMSLVTANVQHAIQEKAQAAMITIVPKPITEDRIIGYIDGVA